LPNPLAWLNEKPWGDAESLKILVGRSHGDLHGDNLLIRIAGDPEDPYYLIDFLSIVPRHHFLYLFTNLKGP